MKELKAQIEQEDMHRDQEILDEPVGELGFTDGEMPGEVRKAASTLRKLGATITAGGDRGEQPD